jgi:hypothetical protein
MAKQKLSKKQLKRRERNEEIILWIARGVVALIGLGIAAGAIWGVVAITIFIATPSPTSGTIMHHRYEAAGSSTYCADLGNGVVSCSDQDSDAEYGFDLYNAAGQHGWVEVSATDYKTYRIGDRYQVRN